ncbi:MAG: hypothetical protein LBH43_20795 [Treponema sp.]|jgi:DNA-binding transcriptional MerR regulator|nr:hypothetical protein [Treponema sp.]
MNTATIPEIARLKGVTRQALEQYRDIRGIEPAGKRGRASLYNVSDFDDTAKPKRQQSEWREVYERERALKMQIQNQKARGELIDRLFVARVFSEIYGTHRSILVNIAPSLSDTLAAIAGTAEAEKILKMQEIIDSEIYNALSAIKSAVNKFMRQFDIDEINDDIPMPKPAAKKKRRTAG